MGKICASTEQSQKLIELGIDVNTADMIYYWFGNSELNDEWYELSLGTNKVNDKDIPAWSLSALLELMPERIKIGEELSFCLTSKKSLTGFGFGYNLNGTTFVKDNPVDAAFEMVCWLKENNKI